MHSGKAIVGLFLVICGYGCASRFPVREGESLTYARCEKPIPPGGAGYERTLQVRWLGTSCHLIQVGDISVLTDPYFSHFRPTKMAFGKIASDVECVRRWTHDLPKPQAIFVGHAHYDHMFDLAETLRQRNWHGTPIYGGPTMANIAAGYGAGIERDCRVPQVGPDWIEIDGPRLAYRAFSANHAPHLPGVFFFPGEVTTPRTTPPTRARHFPVGETFAYLFRLRGSDQSEFTVFINDAATDGTVGIPDDLPQGVDVAILCVPGWRNVDDYPVEAIRRLRPRVIVLSHLNNFLQEGWAKRELVATADLKGFLERARSACNYPEFERIVVTDVGSTVQVASAPQ